MILSKIFGSKKDLTNAVRDLTSAMTGELKKTNIYDGKGFLAGIFAGQDELKKALGDTFDNSKVDDYIASLNGLSETQKIAVINSSNLTKAQKAEMLARINNTKATETETVSQVAETGADMADMMANKANEESEEEVAKAKLKVAAANKTETASQVAETTSDVADTASNLGSKLKGIGSGVLSVVKKHPVVSGIIAAVGIGFIGKKIYDKFHISVEEATETVTKLNSEIKECNDTIKNMQSTTDDVAKSFAELAQGVNQITGQNISLSTEEYEEFLELSNKIAELFPSLPRIFDENGNAIVQLSGDVDTIVGSLKKLVEVQKQLTNKEIVDKLPDLYENSKVLSDSYKNNIYNLEGDYKYYENLIEQLKHYNVEDLHQLTNEDPYFLTVSDRILRELGFLSAFTTDEFDDFGHLMTTSIDPVDPMGYMSSDSDYFKFIEEQKDRLPDVIDDLLEEYNKELSRLSTELSTTVNDGKGIWNNFNQSLSAWLYSDSSLMLSDDILSYVNTMIGNIKWGDLDFDTSEEAQKYIINNIIKPMQQNSEVAELYKKLFSLKPGDLDRIEIAQQLQNLLNNMEIDGVPVSINISDVVIDEQNAKDRLQASIQDIVGIDPSKPSENRRLSQEAKDEYNTLQRFTKDFNVAEIEMWLSIYDASKSALENIKAYNAEKAKSDNKNVSYTEYMSNLEKLSQGLDQLGGIYEDVQNKDDFDWSSLLNNDDFKNSFSGLGEEYDNFIKTITTSPDDIEACQTAFDELASAYINESEVLKDVTKETRNATVAFLEQKGIKNAASEVDRILAQKEKELTLETKYLALAHEDLVNATTESINELVKEGKITEEVANQMELLAFKKQWANRNTLNTKEDIENLVALAQSSIELSEMLDDYAYAKEQLKRDIPGVSPEVWKKEIADIEDEIKNYLNGKFGSNLNVDEYETPDLNSGKNNDDTIDWIETRFSRIQRVIDNFGKTVSSTWKSWEDRNNAILKQLPELENKLRNQSAAAAEYLAEANKIGLTEKNDKGIAYTTLVQQGAIDIEKITSEDLRDKISKYQDLWEKYLEMTDAQADTEQEIVDKYNEQMDLTESKFDAKINLIESRIGVIDSLIAQEEAQGHLVSKSYYETMLAEQTANRNALIEKKKQLEADFAYAIADSKANGVEITEGSEQWYEWKARIIEVESAINGLNTELIETGNLIREVDWEVFDFKQERISKLTEEADYLIGLMSNEKLYDDNTGELTNYGDATAGLHATNYNVYKLQAQEYAKELAEIDKQLKEDPYDTKLLARRDELLESHRDMVNAAEDEKMAIRDMVEEGYNILIDSIQEIIDKNMEAKNSIKDLYDYEKSISEKTKNISSLEKKIASTEGDNSEEAQAQIQKWKVELEEAEQDLYETEWERQLSDEQKMLDGLVEDAQDWIDKRLENIDKLLSDIVANTNAESGTIAKTLDEVAEKFNTPISSEIEKFFDTDNESAVSDFLNNFTDEETGVFKVVNGIKDGVDDMVEYLKQQVDENTDGNGSDGNSGNNSGGSGDNSGNNSNNTPSDTNKNPSNDKNNTKGDGKPKVGDRVIFDNGIYYSTEYGTGKTGNQMLGKEVFITKIASSGTKRYHIGRTSKHGERNLGWVDLEQLKGYYTGSKYIDEDQWAWTQEKGREVIVRKDGSVLTPLSKGDMVLNNAATETFYKLMNNPKIMEMLDSMIMPQISAGTSLPNLVNKGVNNTQSVEINLGGIQMYGVNDPEKFAVQLQHALKTDRMSEKIVQSIAWDKAMGRNSLSKHRY